jgi:hypothetical protein
MKTKNLSEERILEIVGSSKDVYECLLNLYKEVLFPIQWEEIETMKPWGVQINRKTSEFILQEMHNEFTGHDGDPWIVNSLILNKGFSSQYDDLKDWEVRITDDCYTLKS